MAAQVPHKKIRLTEEDVPGAKLPNPVVSANSVLALRRFLLVRGCKIPTSVRKPELVELVEDSISSNAKINPSVDQGKWLAAKAQIERRNALEVAHSSSNFDTFPILGWKTFPSLLIPELFQYGMIYKHIMATNSVVDDEYSNEEEENTPPTATAKPLVRGRQYFVDGHVQELENALSVQGHYCLRAKVRASMKKEKFTVLIKLNKISAEVMDAECHCKASSMGRCSHICALLLALEDYKLHFGSTPPPCTSSVCQWNKGRRDKSSAPAFERKYTNKRDPSRVMNFKPITTPSALDTVAKLKFVAQSTHRKCMWDMILEYTYDDYTITEERNEILEVLCSQLQDALRFGLAGPHCIEGTEMQRELENWKRLRSFMITASCCSKYLTRDEGNVSKKISDLLWEPPSTFDNIYLKYGRENEDTARRAYAELKGNAVSVTGLWVNPKYPGLGASPDGIVTCGTTGEQGLIEIKCCYISRAHKPTDIEVLTKEQRSRFYLKKEEGQFRIPRNHTYYRQMQMQLGITEFKWCEFVIWTPHGLFVERVELDEGWWNNAALKLLNFHSQYVCPEYFEMRLPRKLPPIQLV